MIATASALHPDDPRQVGPYRLTGRLGEGGQGVVFLGQGSSGTTVAVKLLKAHLAGDAYARERFVREINAARQVAPYCTAAVLDADLTGDIPYVVSEYVDGPSLQQLITRGGPRTGAALEQLAVGTLAALEAIHNAGIVHRDFKPANILMSPEGPRVIDFGIARALDAASATITSGAIGTPAYMAPEQLAGERVSTATDMFAWGITIVYAATGTPAFGNDNIPAIINRILHTQPDLSTLPDPLRSQVRRCLSRDGADRPTAPELLDQLAGRTPAHDQPQPRPTAVTPTKRPGRPPTAHPTRTAWPVRAARAARAHQLMIRNLVVSAVLIGILGLVGWVAVNSPTTPSPSSSHSPSAAPTVAMPDMCAHVSAALVDRYLPGAWRVPAGIPSPGTAEGGGGQVYQTYSSGCGWRNRTSADGISIGSTRYPGTAENVGDAIAQQDLHKIIQPNLAADNGGSDVGATRVQPQHRIGDEAYLVAEAHSGTSQDGVSHVNWTYTVYFRIRDRTAAVRGLTATLTKGTSPLTTPQATIAVTIAKQAADTTQ